MSIIDRIMAAIRSSGELAIGEIEDEEIDAEEVSNHGYVVVNLTKKAFMADGHLVMPIEEPCTHMTLNEALNLVARVHEEDARHKYGETVRIYRLAPIPASEIRSMFDLLKEIQET